jgi:hypothetical protein
MGLAGGARRREPPRQAQPAQAAQTNSAALGTAPAEVPSRAAGNLELHFVALLAHKPELLYEANVALTRAKLLTLSADDFTNPVLQLAFNQLSRVAMGAEVLPNPANEDWLVLISEMAISEADEARLREEAMRTALRIREANLKREQEALPWLIQDARDSKDDESLQRYNLRARETGRNWLSAQKALRLRNAVHVS